MNAHRQSTGVSSLGLKSRSGARKPVRLSTASGYSATGAKVSGDEIAVAIADPSVIAAVRAVLGPAGRGDDVEDVLSSAAERALREMGKFDPERGTVRVWVKVIAHSRAKDHLARLSRERRLQTAVEQDAQSASTSVYSPSYADPTEEAVDRLTGQQHARMVAHLVPRFCSNPLSWSRVQALLQECDGDVRRAAWLLGIGEDAVKDSRREVSRIAIVIDRALRSQRTGAPVSMDVLLGCLPTATEDDRHWSRIITQAVCEVPGGFDQVTVAYLVRRTSFSENTARQYLAETRRLLRVAYTVMQSGDQLLAETEQKGTNG